MTSLDLAALRDDDPKGKIFERLISAGMSLEDAKPAVLSKFLLKVLSEGNSELFMTCAKQLTPEYGRALESLIKEKQDSKAAELYLKATNGILRIPQAVFGLISSNGGQQFGVVAQFPAKNKQSCFL